MTTALAIPTLRDKSTVAMPAEKAFAREVDAAAGELGTSSAQVAIVWLRQRGQRIIPIVGVRKMEQLQDVLGSLDVQPPADQLARLDKSSRIEFGFPYSLLSGPRASWSTATSSRKSTCWLRRPTGGRA